MEKLRGTTNFHMNTLPCSCKDEDYQLSVLLLAASGNGLFPLYLIP